MKKLTHLDRQGRAKMVDVTGKPVTEREAIARGTVSMKPETLKLIAGRKGAERRCPLRCAYCRHHGGKENEFTHSDVPSAHDHINRYQSSY